MLAHLLFINIIILLLLLFLSSQLLIIFNKYKARCLLVAMGFSPADVRTSLLLFNNDQQAACDWLLGYKPHPLLEDDLEVIFIYYFIYAH
jgi:hypothetical protein